MGGGELWLLVLLCDGDNINKTPTTSGPLPCCDDDMVVIEDTQDPCEKMNTLATDETFKGYLSALKNFASNTTANANKEVAYTRDGTGNYSVMFEGKLGKGYVDAVIPNPIDIHMHTHPPQVLDPDSLPVFSADDIYTIYKLLNTNLISNTSNFSLVLVTENTTYALSITSKTKFLQSFAGFFNIPGDTNAELGIEFLKNTMKNHYKIDPKKSDSVNELNFTNMLKNLNKANGGVGLQIHKANTDFSEWKTLATSPLNSGTIVEVPCQ